MPTEIERKFLVADDSWRERVSKSYLIRQGYLAPGTECSVRVRKAGDRAFVTIKGAKASRSRPEYEYEIPVADADEMLDTLVSGQIIEKRRHHVPFGGRVWEVDEFETPQPGLVVAEVELDAADASLDMPAWLGPEVTEDPRYGNASMSMAPEGSTLPHGSTNGAGRPAR
ncbi:CYTH domain-containing protein [Lutibaculum baratangense]|nr:CYTH domain-containing protein [Lutibaculum baratangense]